jgi:hypothetical protein
MPQSGLDSYSGTPLPKKLGIKPGCAVALLGAPADFELTLGNLPDGVEIRRDQLEGCDLAIWFPECHAELRARVLEIGAGFGAGGLWVAWPKKASGIASDLSEPIVREAGLASGLVDYKICAIDATWSGLKFARRKAGANG